MIGEWWLASPSVELFLMCPNKDLSSRTQQGCNGFYLAIMGGQVTTTHRMLRGDSFS